MCFDFEMGFPGQNLMAEIRVFENPNPNKNLEHDSNTTRQHL